MDYFDVPLVIFDIVYRVFVNFFERELIGPGAVILVFFCD